MKEAVVIWAKRTPFGKYGGALRHLEPEALLLPLFQNLKQTFPEVMDQVDDVVLGNVVGNGGNVARKSLLSRVKSSNFWHNFRPSMWLGFRKYHLCVSNGAM